MVQPLSRPKVIKKYTKRFKRHQYDRKIAVKVSCKIDLQPLVQGAAAQQILLGS